MINNEENESQVRIVQFIHPGPEHYPSKKDVEAGDNVFSWNYKSHKRKFMKASGTCVDDKGNQVENGLYFWGEWEPTSRITSIKWNNLSGDYPLFLHEPFFDTALHNYPPFHLPDKDQDKYHRQNTDPFVFGDHFLYSICKQDSYKVLRTLAPGSIILFGSLLGKKEKHPYFALDTVLVVGNAFQYKPCEYEKTLSGIIPPHYDKIMGFKDWDDSKEKYLYQGVNLSEKDAFRGMYSFVPCKLGKDGEHGFERIKLSGLDFIADNLSQGLKATDSTFDYNIECWNQICEIVRSQGCHLGVHFDFDVIE